MFRRVRPLVALLAQPTSWGVVSFSVTIFALTSLGEARSPSGSGPGSAPVSRDTRMSEILEQLAARTDAENPWLGGRDVQETRERLAALDPAAPLPVRVELLRTLGDAELRMGETDAAIEHLEAALALVGRPRNPTMLRASLELRDDLQIAWLRLAENQNCVAHACCTSCLYPFDENAVHSEPEAAKRALALQLELLSQKPGDPRLRWLAHVTAAAAGTPERVPEALRIAAPTPKESSFPRFENAAAEFGLDHFSLSGGVMIEDFDGDLDLDVITSSFDPRHPLRFLRNDEGRFVDASAGSGLEALLGGLNLVPADYDGDGDLDFLVLRGAWLEEAGRHPNSLVRNEGDGRFVDVTMEAGLYEPMYPTQTAAWADYDQDGDLDLYIGNECRSGDDWWNQLFRNEGDGTFTDVAEAAGVQDGRYTKGVAFGDYDEDGYPDLFVSNLGGRNRLYHNEGDGTFAERTGRLDLGQPLRSFGAWFFDANQDGHLDLFVTSYQNSFGLLVDRLEGRPTPEDLRARLCLGDGKGGFTDVASEWGIDATHPPMGANFGDLDSDGFPDVYLGTGFPSYDALLPNQLFHNVPGPDGGRRFLEVTTESGTGHLQKGHGISFADLDGDFDTDLFAQMGGAFPGDGFADAWFRNPGFGNEQVKIRLVGTITNRSAIGASLHAEIEEDGVVRTVHHFVGTGGSFGASPLLAELGVGKAREIRRLTVHWPTSRTDQVFEHVPVHRMLRITEGAEGYELLD